MRFFQVGIVCWRVLLKNLLRGVHRQREECAGVFGEILCSVHKVGKEYVCKKFLKYSEKGIYYVKLEANGMPKRTFSLLPYATPRTHTLPRVKRFPMLLQAIRDLLYKRKEEIPHGEQPR